MRSSKIFMGISIVLLLVLTACGPAAAGVQPTLSSAATQVAPTVSSAATQLAPTIAAAASQVAPTLAAAATQAAPTLSSAATQVAPTVSAAATQIAPTIAAATQLVPTLSAAATQAAPTLSAAATQIAPTLSSAATKVASGPTGKTYVLVPRVMGSALYDEVNQGAQQAAAEIGTSVTYLGSAAADAAQASQLINSLMSQKVNGLAVAGSGSDVYAAAARQAVSTGIPVVSWELPLPAGSGSLFVSPVAPQAVSVLVAKMIGDEAGAAGGKVAVLSSSASAAFQDTWIAALKAELQKPANSKLQWIEPVFGNDEDAASYASTKDLLAKNPDLKVVVGATPVASAAAARAVKDANLAGKVFVTGLGTPNLLREYVKSGIAVEFAAWNPNDLGYLTVYALDALAGGKIKGAAGESFSAGRLKQFSLVSDPSFGPMVVLGEPTLVSKDTIDSLNY